MYWEFTPYIIPLLLAAIISAALAFFAWQRRSTPGATPFVVFMAAVMLWSLAYALELAGTNLETKIFWARVKYTGIPAVPVAWLAFALQYTNQDAWLTRKHLTLLSIIPMITILLMWTNPIHQLMWVQPRLNTDGPFTIIQKNFGGWFWVHFIYTYVLLLIGTVMLIRMLLRSPHLYRWQVNTVLVAVSVPWLVNIISVFGLSPVPNLDLTPFAFAISGLAFGWALLRYRLLDVVPIARRAVIDSMNEGIIVLDKQNRVVDLNSMARQLLNNKVPNQALGKPFAEAFEEVPELVERCRRADKPNTEIEITSGHVTGYFSINISPLYDKKNHLTGRLIILRNITQRKQAEAEREKLLALEQEQRLQAETLREVSLALASQTNLQAVLDEILHQTQRVVPYQTAHIMLLEENKTLRSAAWQGYEDFGSERLISGLVQHLDNFPMDARVIQTRQTVVIPDTTKEPHWIVQPETAWVKSHLTAPLTLQNQVLGLLRLDGNTPNQFSEKDGKVLAPLANAAAVALENARLLAAEQQRAEELASLVAASTAISASLNIRQVIQIVAEQMAKLLGVDGCTISKWDQHTHTLTLWAQYAPETWKTLPKWFEPTQLDAYPLTDGVLKKARPAQLQINASNTNSAESAFMHNTGLKSMLLIPLITQDRTIGLAELMDSRSIRVFDDREIVLIQTLANQAAIAIENAQLMSTEQKRIGQLTRARDQALEANRIKSELLGRVSHELRTPLGIILGYTEMLHDSVYGDISEEQREPMQKIIDTTVNLTARVNDLLDQSQLEAKTLKLYNQSFAPIDLIDHVQSALREQAANKSVSLTFTIADDVPPFLSGDFKRLSQILNSLVENALKFTDQGQVQMRIYSPEHDLWAMAVSDTGIGIPAEAQAHIFEPFWQLDSSATREYGGTGLGLSIVKELVELMEGRIYLESKEQQGTTFTVLLPLLPVPEMAIQ